MKWPFWNRCNLSKKRTIKYFNYCLEESFVKAGILVYFKEIWSGLGGIIFFNVQNIKITTFFKKITKILWKYLPKKQELLLGSPKLHQPGIFKSDIFVFNKKKLLIYIKATGGNTKIPSEITQIALKCTFQCPQNSFLGKAPSLP